MQGAGSFTPVTNGPSGSDGSYSSTSGFWWSVPTTKTRSGTGYVAGSTATLKAGAVFTTTVTFVFLPCQTYAANYVSINQQTNKWNATNQPSGTLIDQSASETYLSVGAVAGSWKTSVPTITSTPDGTTTFTGALTFTTSKDVTIAQTGTKSYARSCSCRGTSRRR